MAEAPTIHVDIVSPEGELFSGPATMVFASASEGDLGIAPRHAPLLTLLKPGEVRVRTPDGEEHHFFVGGGALEVQPSKVTVLGDTALRARDIDEAAALAAKQRAEDALRDKAGHITLAEAQAELARAIAQLKVLNRLRKLRG
jgi:F-type H+-transporting ATPase subunit epsilon